MPFLYTYLIDENGDYILDENGDRIIIDSVEYTDGTPWRRIASSIRRDIPYVRSFEIRPNPSRGGTFMLVVNQRQLVGMNYPTVNDALSVLYGCFTRSGGQDSKFVQAISEQLTKGVSKIDAGEAEAPAWTADPTPSATDPVVGDTAVITGGTTSGSPLPTLSYQWKRDGSDIAGATSRQYDVVVADGGTALTCVVTATNSEGSADVTVDFGTPAIGVADIRLFMAIDADPTSEVTSPIQGRSYYAVAYDADGNPITPVETIVWSVS